MGIDILLKPCIYIYYGVMFILNLIGSFFKYILLGIKAIFGIFTPHKKEKTANISGDALLIEAKKDEEKKRIQEEKARKKANKKLENSTRNELQEYLNNNDKLLDEDKPKKKLELFKKKEKEINLPEITVNFDGEDAVKSEKKQTYEYLIKTPENKVVKGYFSAFSKVEVYSFLKSEGNKVYEIKTNKWINLMYGTTIGGHDKFKTKDLIFFIAQLSTYLKAGITLADACKILVKQFQSPKYKRILNGISYDLSIGFSFSEALEKQTGTFPSILINMVKTAEMTGELPETLDDMEEYFSEIEATRKAMITAMMYPAIIFVIAVGVGTFIMLYVVPKFVDIYDTMDNAKIPDITLAVLAISEFLQNYIIYIGVLFLIIIILLIYLYKNVQPFRRNMQWFLMHLPVFGNVIIYNEVTTFTKTFSSLLSHNVFITDSMEILNKVTNNEIYKELIYKAIKNVSKGKSMSLAFKDEWAFPIPAYEMIYTGEKTGQLPEMMKKVSVYYQDLHKNSVTRIKTFVEPALIVMLTAMVGVIVLSIVVPMFSMYSQIQA